MKKLKKRLAARLRGTKGESLAEVLVALLIAALSLTMLASAIFSSSSIINNSKKAMDTYYSNNDELAKQSKSDPDQTNLTLLNDENNDGAADSESAFLYLRVNSQPEVYIYDNKTVISYRLSD